MVIEMTYVSEILTDLLPRLLMEAVFASIVITYAWRWLKAL